MAVIVRVTNRRKKYSVLVRRGLGHYRNSDNTYNVSIATGETVVGADITVTDSDGSQYNHPANKDVVCSLPVGCDVENSDGTYDVHVNNGGTLVLPDTVVKNTVGATVLTQPSATSTGVIADSVVTNSDNTFSLNVPAETNPVLADITVTEPDLSTYTYPAAKDITLPDNRNAYFYFIATYDDNQLITADANAATTWTTETLTNVATVAYEKNSVAASLPITLVATDTLKVTITRTNAALDSLVKLNN